MFHVYEDGVIRNKASSSSWLINGLNSSDEGKTSTNSISCFRRSHFKAYCDFHFPNGSRIMFCLKNSSAQALSPDGHQMNESKSAEDRGQKSEDEGIGYFVGRIRNVLPLLRHNKPTAETLPVITTTETIPGTSTAEAALTMSAERQSHAESDVLTKVAKPKLERDRIELTTQEETATQIMHKKLQKEPEEKRPNVDIHHFHKPYVLPEAKYWFIIFKAIIASLCVMLNIIHLLSTVGLFPPAFSFFGLKTTNYNDAMALATNNINKLLKNRVGLAVRWVPYSKELKSENYSNCMVLINNYQWSQWTKFEESTGGHCGTKIYIRYYNLRIVKVFQSNSQEIQQTHCPATVQYKRTWERACCQQSDDLQPLENYVNLSYDKAFCIEKLSLRNVNASELSKVCKIGKLWTPLPRATFPVNNSYYHRSNLIKNYEIQRGAVLNNYWIGVERTDGKHWLVSGNRMVLDSQPSCENHCYSAKILLSAEAYKKYLDKKKHFVCVKDEKWELFSSADSEECLAVCITKADDNSN